MKSLCNHGVVVVGQCYEKADHIYEVVAKVTAFDLWRCKNNLTQRDNIYFKTEDFLNMRRPYCNCYE